MTRDEEEETRTKWVTEPSNDCTEMGIRVQEKEKYEHKCTPTNIPDLNGREGYSNKIEKQ